MSLLQINLGTYPNDGTGDDLLTAFTKVNSNFASLDGTISVNGGTNLGVGTGIYANKNSTNLEFKSLTSTSNSVIITANSTTVNLEAITNIKNDISPALGADLNLNSYNVTGVGDVQTTVHGLDTRILNTLLGILINQNSLTVDMGTFINPAGIKKDTNGNVIGGDTRGYNLDFGGFVLPVANTCDFGSIE